MIPTFDAYNLVRIAVRAALSLLSNPLVITIALATSAGVVIGSACSVAFNDYLTLNSVGAWSIDDDTGLFQLVCYCLNSGQIKVLVNGYVQSIVFLVPFLFASLSTTFVALMVRNYAMAQRAATKDVGL